MSYLAQAVNRQKPKGIRTVIYGQEGSGKTTLAASARKAILLPTEDGWVGLPKNSDLVILPTIPSFEHVEGIVKELGSLYASNPAGFPFETIILDSATAFERLVHNYTLRCDPKYVQSKGKMTMESAHGGYGSSYTFANDVFTKMLSYLDWFVSNGINVTITCHAMAITEKDTIAGDEYTTMDCSLHSPKNGKSTGKREILKQWCDILGYLHTPVYVTGKDGGFKTAMSATTDKVLGLHSNPKYAAKNRFSVQEPIVIPKDNGWDVLLAAIKGDTSNIVKAPVLEPPVSEDAGVAPIEDMFANAVDISPDTDMFNNDADVAAQAAIAPDAI